MKKSEITAILKQQFKLDKVRIDTDLDIAGKGKAHRANGSFVPAIYAWGHSPLDSTNAGLENSRAKFRAVRDFVLDNMEGAQLALNHHDLATVVFNGDSKKPLVLAIGLERFPTYIPGRHMDPGYRSSYVTISFTGGN